MSNPKRCVFLDFDGVLFNTVKEAYAVTCLSMKEYSDIEQVNFNTELYYRFLRFRYLVGPAWNYKYVWDLLKQQEDKKFEQSYIDLRDDSNLDERKSFEKLFFSTRERLKSEKFDQWLMLNTAYDFFDLVRDTLKSNSESVFIVTRKDKGTVDKLLKLNGVCLRIGHIFDRMDYEKSDKAGIIESVMRNKEIDQAIFVDDNMEHLQRCRDIKNLTLYHARWGYTSCNNVTLEEQNVRQVSNAIKELIGVECV